MSKAKRNEKEKSKVKFVDEEKMMFIELVAEFWPNQLASKKQDSKTLQLKEQAWSSIRSRLYESLPGIQPKETDKLKRAWENWSSKAKKTTADDKATSRETGVGDATLTASTLDHRIMDIIGRDMAPLVSQFDSDQGYHDEMSLQSTDGETVIELEVNQKKPAKRKPVDIKVEPLMTEDMKELYLEKMKKEIALIDVDIELKKKKIEYLDQQIKNSSYFHY